jgi:DNA-binding transcriptional MerR regulator/methylmalonyl-CoA mutase cobalamin-binding subunit
MAMTEARRSGESPLSISAVERDTGISKDTLRVWERRYRFPVPERDEHGERAYSREQVEKLRALKRLIDRGHRPSKIIGHSMERLLELIEHAPAAAAPAESRGLDPMIELVRAHRVDELRQALGQQLMRQGFAQFLLETVGPLTQAIGDSWMRGGLEVFEEHLYTETLQGVLRNAIASVPRHDRPPRLVLTTFPNELHGLGLLMAEGIFALEGATSIALGTQTPIGEIAAATTSQQADVVALSFSLSYPVNQALEGLGELRARLSRGIEIWAGGTNPGIVRRPVAGVIAIPELATIPVLVARWRAAHERT